MNKKSLATFTYCRKKPDFNDSDLGRVTCIALNKLPTKFYCHRIGLKSCSSEGGRIEIRDRISEPIHEAATVV
jgi:hypothetical protein